MSKRDTITSLARVIAGNVERIADNLPARARLIEKDVSEMLDLIRDLHNAGGDRAIF